MMIKDKLNLFEQLKITKNLILVHFSKKKDKLSCILYLLSEIIWAFLNFNLNNYGIKNPSSISIRLLEYFMRSKNN